MRRQSKGGSPLVPERAAQEAGTRIPPLFVNVRTTSGLVGIWTLGAVDVTRNSVRVGGAGVGRIPWDLRSLSSRGLVIMQGNIARPSVAHPYRGQIQRVVELFAARYGVEIVRHDPIRFFSAPARLGSAEIFGHGLANEILIVLAACGVCVPRAIVEAAPAHKGPFGQRMHEFQTAGIVRKVRYRSFELISLDPVFFAAVELRELLDAIVERERAHYRRLAKQNSERWPILGDERLLESLGFSQLARAIRESPGSA
jgi:hypothetical protein